ncbi:MAG: hypothetical protein HQK50_15920 [Oligoflexia bacterium]|nr:hypothetical protein [Oligoflexia bacterium]
MNKCKLKVELYYALMPLKEQLIIGHEKVSAKEILLIKISDKSGFYGWGECAPLRGVHPYSFEECVDLAYDFAEDFDHFEIDPQKFSPEAPFAGLIALDNEAADEADDEADEADEADEEETPPALLFAFEQALWSWYFNKYPKQKEKYFITTPTSKLRVHKLINNLQKLPHASELSSKHPEIYKIKVARKGVSLQEELSLLENFIKNNAHPEDQFIFDANGGFTLESCQAFLEGVSKFLPLERIRYLEDPFKDKGELSQSLPLKVAYAIDDLFLEYLNNLADIPASVSTIIIRPTLLSLGALCTLLQEVRPPLQVVFSSTYDTHLTLNFYESLASLKCLHPLLGRSHGLDTSKYTLGDPFSATTPTTPTPKLISKLL